MVTHTMRLAVITDMSCTVLGTQQLLDPAAVADAAAYSQRIRHEGITAAEVERMPVFSRLVAGQDQQEYEIEVDLPDQLFQAGDVGGAAQDRPGGDDQLSHGPTGLAPRVNSGLNRCVEETQYRAHRAQHATPITVAGKLGHQWVLVHGHRQKRVVDYSRTGRGRLGWWTTVLWRRKLLLIWGFGLTCGRIHESQKGSPVVDGAALALVTKRVVDLWIWAHLRWVRGCPLPGPRELCRM